MQSGTSCDRRLYPKMRPRHYTSMPEDRELYNLDLAARYPRTIAAFTAMGALDHLDRILKLDQAWDGIRSGRMPKLLGAVYDLTPSPARPSPVAYDLIYAGGGL